MPPTRAFAILTLTLSYLATSPLLAVPPGVSPIAFEKAERSRFVDAKFPGLLSRENPDSGLVVAGGGTNWWDRVQLDSAWGKPFRLDRKIYRRGLFCHAPRQLVVKLPKPGKTFSSAIGLLSFGTVTFAVTSGGKELFRSGVIRQSDDVIDVEVALDGARELTLVTEDAGDAIGGDHGVWADARVTLDDGSELWLSDLDILEGQDDLAFEKRLPFSFQYGGKSSAELLPNWKKTVTGEAIDEQRRGFTMTFTDPETKLEVRCEGIEYRDFPTVEWTVYFRNNGSQDTPILEDIRAIDMTLPNHASDGRAEFVLHHHLGSQATREDYAPRKTVLTANESKRFRPPGGRPSSHVWPYFNIQRGGTGFILALGWPGQWAAEFARDAGTNLHVRGGQEVTHLKLHPGEEIRTPLVVLQFYNGDRVRSQNIWRRWMLAHNLPRPGGKLPEPQLAASSTRCFSWMYSATEENQKQFIDIYARENIALDYWWMDTGWGDAALGPNAERFPNGLRPISERARKFGAGTVLWFEAERTQKTAKLAKEHPDWVLWAPGNDQGLLDFGNPDALRWVNDAVHTILDEDLIDYYRVDFNMDPLEHWRNNEAEDRRGMVENKWVTGFLAHWDELLRRNPNLRIDCCASGGRRNDLESMRRGVPLWRSDYTDRSYLKENTWQRGEATGMQGHVYGVSMWLPYHGHALDYPNPTYQARSNFYPSIAMNIDVREEGYDFETLRETLALWRVVAPNYMGDFYPLTPYSLEEDVWMVWQFHRPEVGEGLVQAYQRDESIYPAVQLRLRGLDRDAEYEITNHDHPDTTSHTGAELMDRGLRITVEFEERPAAVIITYKRK
jgi:alpha-galactosidase